jgi:hypothetical protein
MAIEVFPASTITDLLLTGTITSVGSASTSLTERAYVTGDTSDRFQAQADGKRKWGPGNAATDVILARSGVGTLSLTGKLTVSGDTNYFGPFADSSTVGTRLKILNTSATVQLIGESDATTADVSVYLQAKGAGTILFLKPDGTNGVSMGSGGSTHFYGSVHTFDGTVTTSGRITGDSGSAVPSAYFGDSSQDPGGTVGIMPYTARKGLVIKNPATFPTSAIEHVDSSGDPLWRIVEGTTEGVGAGNFGAGALGAASGYINLTGTGNDALIAAGHGTLANASLVIMSKGTGMIQILDGSGSQLLQIFARAAVSNLSTAMKIFWVDNTSAFRYDSVTVGAADSGGSGKRILLVPN